MKQYSDFKAERSGSGRETLPAGGYVCQILSAKIEQGNYGDTLIIAHDVCEGDYEGIFKRDFENNDREDKKWRGIFRLRLPKDDGSEQDGWKKRAFNNFIWAVEQSNSGFAWAWDEKKLKGKKIGLIYRNKEWEFNGRSGWTTEAGASDSVDNIREKKFRLLKDKPLANRPAEPVMTDEGSDDSDLPF